MANFTVTPQALTFNTATVRGPIAGLYAAAQTMTFVLKNTSGNSVTITNYGFSSSTAGDAVTQPAGILYNSDFVVVPTAGLFPVTVANNATQSFTVTYAPLRRGSGFGDIRSAILALFTGNVALTNGGQIRGLQGEVVNNSVPVPVTVGVGGGVVEEAYGTPRVAPIYWGAGDPSKAGTIGTGVVNASKGMSPSFTIADLDTIGHGSPYLFFAASVTGSQAETTPIAPVAATYTTGSATVPYAIKTPVILGSPRGGRGYQVLVFWTDDSVTMDITIRAITSAGHVQVAFFPAVTYSNAGGLFIGNSTGLDLQGLSLTVQTTVTAGSTAYNIGALITG